MEFIEGLRLVHPFSRDIAQALTAEVLENSYPKGTQLLELGQVDRYVHFIVKGSGRVYYIKKGVDITDYIAMDRQFLGGVISVFTGQPSEKAIEITEDALVQSIPISKLETLAATHHQVETLYRKMMTWAFLECQQRIEDLRFLTAAERYQALEKKHPGISNRIPLKHIATYIGTSQVNLSRIRAGAW